MCGGSRHAITHALREVLAITLSEKEKNGNRDKEVMTVEEGWLGDLFL